MNLIAYLSMKLRCTEQEAQAVLHVRDTMVRLAGDRAFGDGIHALSIVRGRNLLAQSIASADKREALFGAAEEAFDLPMRLHGIIQEVDAWELEFKARPKSGQTQTTQEEP